MTYIKTIIGILLFFVCGVSFYFADIQYRVPLQIPISKVVDSVSPINVSRVLETNNQLTLLHFYNRMCPCSRYNEGHFMKLVEMYSDSVNFIVVINPLESEKNIQAYYKEDFGNLPYLVDTNNLIASTFGVFTTPQAVLLGGSNELIYKGMYNSSTFCNKPNTAFVAQSIVAHLSGESVNFSQNAAQYGCELGKKSLFVQLFNTP